MSYHIDFIKRNDLTSQNIETILETDVLMTDQHFVSKQLMLEIKDKLMQAGLKFEVFEGKDKDCLELNFPTYQIGMYNSMVTIAVPYWDDNSKDSINWEMEIIQSILLDYGFTGYDPQTEAFIISNHGFKSSFNESKSLVDKTFNMWPKDSSNYKYVGIGAAILIIGIIIWLLLN
jgi:hypothetical protein